MMGSLTYEIEDLQNIQYYGLDEECDNITQIEYPCAEYMHWDSVEWECVPDDCATGEIWDSYEFACGCDYGMEWESWGMTYAEEEALGVCETAYDTCYSYQ